MPEKNVSAVGVQLGEPASWALPPASWTLIDVTWPSCRPGTETRASMPAPSSLSVTVPEGTRARANWPSSSTEATSGVPTTPTCRPDCEPTTVPCRTAAPVATALRRRRDGVRLSTARGGECGRQPGQEQTHDVRATHDMASFLLAARLTPRGWGPRCSASPGCPGFALSRRSIGPRRCDGRRRCRAHCPAADQARRARRAPSGEAAHRSGHLCARARPSARNVDSAPARRVRAACP